MRIMAQISSSTTLLKKLRNHLIVKLHADTDYYKTRLNKSLVNSLFKLVARNETQQFEDVHDKNENYIRSKTNIHTKKVIKHHERECETKPLIRVREDNTAIITAELQIEIFEFMSKQKVEKPKSITERFYDDETDAVKLDTEMIYDDFKELTETEDIIFLKDFANLSEDIADEDIKYYDGDNLSDCGFKKLTGIKKIEIISRTTESPLTVAKTYTAKDTDGNYMTRTASELDNEPGPRIKTFKFDKESPIVLKKKLLESKDDINEVYVYDARMYKGDRKFDIQIQSFQKLDFDVYNLYGYLQEGSKSKEVYLYSIAARKVKAYSCNVNQITKQQGEHNFYKLVNFFYEHVRSKDLQFDKGRSDIIVLNEVLKVVFQNCGYDDSNSAHSIYAGLKDVGKTTISKYFSSIKYRTAVSTTLGGITNAGLFGGANQPKKLPNHEQPSSQTYGAISGQHVMLEEIMEMFNNRDKNLTVIMERLKDALLEPIVETVKVGGLPTPRNATVTLVGNYCSERIATIRNEVGKMGLMANRAVQKMLAEQQELGEDADVDVLANGGQGSFNNSKFIDICQTSDLFKNIDDYPYETREEKVFKESLIMVRNEYDSRGEDMSSGIMTSEQKRFLFSVYGAMKENLDSTNSTSYSEKVSRFNKKHEQLVNLYIPNLNDLIMEISAKDDKDFDYRAIDNFVNELKSKYKHIFETIAVETMIEMTIKVVKSLMIFNNESTPSPDTKIIVERWVYLQGNKVEGKDVASYKRLNKKIKFIADEEKKLAKLKEVVKDVNKDSQTQS